MPYQQIEEIQSRKGEKIALFLTIENAMGLILAAFPAYVISSAMPFVLRILIVAAAALLGMLATLDIGGMAFYERLLWRVRGYVRQHLASSTITPEHLVGGTPTVRRDRPLPIGGPVQLRPDMSVIGAHLGQRARLERYEPTSAAVPTSVVTSDHRHDGTPPSATMVGEQEDVLHL